MPNRRAMLRALLEARTAGQAPPPPVLPPALPPALPPGCAVEHRIERRDVLLPDQPTRREMRHAARLHGCADPTDNTDWVYGPWVPD